MAKKTIKTQRRKRSHIKPILSQPEHRTSWSDASITPLPHRQFQTTLKRLFDILFSLFALAVTLPIWLVVPLAIRLTSKGPALYKAKRVGRYGHPIYCYKFRSMFSDAEERLDKLLASDSALEKEWKTHWKLKNDPRITPIGNFIRKTSIDEIPQFLNSLMGDMSVVGPRPRVEDELAALPLGHVTQILQIRPGITGLWQTSGRSDIDLEERIKLDEKYIKDSGFFYDLVLILKTIPAALFSKGAR